MPTTSCRISFHPWINDAPQFWACRSFRSGRSVITIAERCFGRLTAVDAWVVSDGGLCDLSILDESKLGPGELVAIVPACGELEAMDSKPVRDNVQSLMPRASIPKGLRYAVLHRDGFRCRYCGASPGDGVVLHIDHIIPVSCGGLDDESNLATSCQACNLGKGNRFHGHPPRQAGRPDPGEAARR